MTDGKRLEGLVAFVEETLLPQGFDVKTNERIFDDEGNQIAEFDIEIRGRVGSTDIAWLIECRDRPGSGPAPGSWIEQLVGRRTRFGFNKVTAVSTTGFARGASGFAATQGIELREVESLSPGAFAGWLGLSHIHHTEQRANLTAVSIYLDADAQPDRLSAAQALVSAATGDTDLLTSVKTKKISPAKNAFLGVVTSQNLFASLEPNAPPTPVQIVARYTNDDDHFVIDTACGPVRVAEIHYTGELSVINTLVPIQMTAEYRRSDSREVISQVVSFQPHVVDGSRLAFEMHRLANTGETHVIVRRLPDDA